LRLKGDITVAPENGEPLNFGVGNLIIFPEGMSYSRQAHKTAKKHYRFSN
tara:strand:- start:417 stop:566 length:150 start_codon:yes stop_codon:yes gene_type:complete